MEKRVFLAMIITVGVFMAYASLNAPTETDPEKADPASTERSADPKGETDTPPGTPGAVPDETPAAADVSAGTVTPAAPIDGPLILETPVFRVELDQLGAVAKSIRLLEHDESVDERPDAEKTWESRLEFIRTFDRGVPALGLTVDGSEGLDLDGVLWSTSGVAADGKSASFHVDVDDGESRYRLSKTIRILEHRNRLGVSVTIESLDPAKPVTRTLWLRTSGGVFPVDRTDVDGVKAKQFGRSVVGSRSGDELETFAMTTKEMIDAEGGPKMFPTARFAADMGAYFGVYLHLLDGGESRGARISSLSPTVGSREALERYGPPRTFSEVGISLGTTDEAAAATADFDYYIGPKDHRAIEDAYPDGDLRRDYLDVADGELMSQGFCCIGSAGPIEGLIKAISKAVVWVLTLFNGWFNSLGVSIIVLTICVRMIMFPVTRKSQVAMQTHSAKMARIKPKLDKLKEKYKDDQKKIAGEQMKLMKEEKVGMVPLGGCLPMFLQIPIFFGLFTAIRFDVDLRHAGFLWCNDLSMPDRVIAWEPIALPCFCMPTPISIDGLNVFPLLMIAAMVVHQMGMPKSPDPQMQQQQKMMMFMPLLFGVMLYSYPAGLAVYWLSSSLFGIFEQRVIRKFFPVPELPKPGTA